VCNRAGRPLGARRSPPRGQRGGRRPRARRSLARFSWGFSRPRRFGRRLRQHADLQPRAVRPRHHRPAWAMPSSACSPRHSPDHDARLRAVAPLLRRGLAARRRVEPRPAQPGPPAGSRHRLVHQLIERQVALRPDAEAVVWPSSPDADRLTYGALNARAKPPGALLRRQDFGPETRCPSGCRAPSTPWSLSLAVLKAGGCYVPLDTPTVVSAWHSWRLIRRREWC